MHILLYFYGICWIASYSRQTQKSLYMEVGFHQNKDFIPDCSSEESNASDRGICVCFLSLAE